MISILSMYAVTPCHAGSGSSFSVIDLPIQRERHTNWPVVHASGMKGAMRAQFERNKVKINGAADELTELVFGSEKSEFSGSLSVSDAKILAFPMRSSFAPFIWITCPAVLARLNKDLKFAGKQGDDLTEVNKIGKNEAFWLNDCFEADKNVLLEDVEVTTKKKVNLPALEVFLAKAERLLIVHDEVFCYGVSHCTSVMAHIAIDQKTGTTTPGSLRYKEELPSDTLLYSVVGWGDSKNSGDQLKAEMIRGYVTEEAIAGHLQVGGDETLGRGIFELEWI
jgi:CRISPR-associated protein Cmr4